MTTRTKRQQVAYEQPYIEDVEAVSSDHTCLQELDDGACYSTVLTVELTSSFGRPTWHASAAMRGSRNPVPLHRLREPEMARVAMVARALLAGVGAGDENWEAGRVALHLRRALSDEELAGLDWKPAP